MKRVVACSACLRQYDVSGYEPGEKLRCACGAVVSVPDRKGMDALVLHCASCGAPVHEDWRECEYCGSPIDRKTSLNTLVCPGCFSRIPEEASYCTHCGIAIRPQSVESGGADQVLHCPRCEQSTLVARNLEGRHFFECPTCCGMFLDRETFSDIVEEMSRRFERDPMPRGRISPGRLEKVVYLRCPLCGEFMARRNYAKRSGVIIDDCRRHGFWLDDGELSKIAAFVARGGLLEARKSETEEMTRLAEQKSRVAAMSLSEPLGVTRTPGPSFWNWVIRSLFD